MNKYILRHDWIYDKDYYELSVTEPAMQSAPIISKSIIEDIKPKTVIDVGCGSGTLLKSLKENGCKVLGLEYSEAGLELCNKNNIDVIKYDIINDTLDSIIRYDVAISLEVAEHLPAKSANRYVSLLSQLSSKIIFTAAPPGQLGTDHVNLQPKEYWINKFMEQGFKYDEVTTEKWKKEWRDSRKVAGWYYDNLMIFDRSN